MACSAATTTRISSFHLSVDGSIPNWPESPRAPSEQHSANHLSAPHRGNMVEYELLLLDLNIWLLVWGSVSGFALRVTGTAAHTKVIPCVLSGWYLTENKMKMK